MVRCRIDDHEPSLASVDPFDQVLDVLRLLRELQPGLVPRLAQVYTGRLNARSPHAAVNLLRGDEDRPLVHVRGHAVAERRLAHRGCPGDHADVADRDQAMPEQFGLLPTTETLLDVAGAPTLGQGHLVRRPPGRYTSKGRSRELLSPISASSCRITLLLGAFTGLGLRSAGATARPPTRGRTFGARDAPSAARAGCGAPSGRGSRLRPRRPRRG